MVPCATLNEKPSYELTLPSFYTPDREDMEDWFNKFTVSAESVQVNPERGNSDHIAYAWREIDLFG